MAPGHPQVRESTVLRRIASLVAALGLMFTAYTAYPTPAQAADVSLGTWGSGSQGGSDNYSEQLGGVVTVAAGQTIRTTVVVTSIGGGGSGVVYGGGCAATFVQAFAAGATGTRTATTTVPAACTNARPYMNGIITWSSGELARVDADPMPTPTPTAGPFDPTASPNPTIAPPTGSTPTGGTSQAICPTYSALQRCTWGFDTDAEINQWTRYAGGTGYPNASLVFWGGSYAGAMFASPAMRATPGLDYGWELVIGTGYFDTTGHNEPPCPFGSGRIVWYDKNGDILAAPYITDQWPGQACIVGGPGDFGVGIKTRAPLGAVAQRLLVSCDTNCGGPWGGAGGPFTPARSYFVDIGSATFDWSSEEDTVTNPTTLGNTQACDPNVDPTCYGPPSPTKPCLTCNPDGGYGQVSYGCGPLSGLCYGKPFLGPVAIASCVRPNEALNVVGWTAFIGCQVGNMPAYIMNGVITGVNVVIDIVFPGPMLEAIIGGFGAEVQGHPPFTWFDQLATSVSDGAATAAGSGGFPTFAIAGQDVDINPALTEAGDAAAPFRGVMVAGVSLVFVLKALASVTSVIAGGGVKTGGGDE